MILHTDSWTTQNNSLSSIEGVFEHVYKNFSPTLVLPNVNPFKFAWPVAKPGGWSVIYLTFWSNGKRNIGIHK